MRYYIQRQSNEYGPYTLADLQRYVASGNILLTDLGRTEATTNWVPVSELLRDVPAAAPALTVPGPAPAAAPAQAPAPAQVPGVPAGPTPTDFHWGLVLLISVFVGIFQLVWLFLEAAFVKKLKPDGNFMSFLIAGVCVQFGGFFVCFFIFIAVFAASQGRDPNPAGIFAAFAVFMLVELAGAVLYVVGIFKMRDAIQNYYNTVEPINLRLSGVMTFFFAVFYFQYHFSRISVWKTTGYLQPQ